MRFLKVARGGNVNVATLPPAAGDAGKVCGNVWGRKGGKVAGRNRGMVEYWNTGMMGASRMGEVEP